jgi:hypothetical protein
MADIKIEKVAVIAKCSDGTMRQIYLSKDNKEVLIHFIGQLEGAIKLFENTLDTVDLK